ncbi:no mechanoreceptor potential c isoform d-related [Anaeramoeba ignava]|uniref:No mechanoreceptor potential c isoform d-related n=1 Tax=Anaeramoeba ignava TaxID=1746090 RepID=A0A9Q0LHY6_ANAIG|nr:no mechanoreceptor potential c isoform d-related [Anaeramoeba ignava]|eukprot:Anaeramoba_ignava/c21382_g2_i2.p1 GENE.c21382_g2_i2~~c21382_g2_i2.p1  ORF type:complete len:1386 (-),score=450.16 c21382_g2_i2:44-4201(-)
MTNRSVSMKKVLYRVYTNKKTYKTLADNFDSNAAQIVKSVSTKVPEIQDPSNCSLYVVANAFERFYSDDEKPLLLGKSLGSKSIKDCKSTLFFKSGTKDQIIVKVRSRGAAIPHLFSIRESTPVKKIVELIVAKEKIIDINLTSLQEKFGKENPVDLNMETPIIDVIKKWGDRYEDYEFIFKNLNKPTIKGMEKFFLKCDNLPIQEIPFTEINKQIMDIIVEGNAKFLELKGFVSDTQGSLEIANDNLAILQKLKDEMESEESEINVFLEQMKDIINEKIDGYLNLLVPKLAKLIGVKGITSIDLLVESFEQVLDSIPEDKIMEYSRKIKDLDSLAGMRNEKIQGGIIDLIKQDLGVYFFNTKNELETGGIDPYKISGKISFVSPPIKQGFLFKKAHGFGRKKLKYFILTSRFVHYFNVKNKEDTIEEVLKETIPQQSYPIPLIKIERTLIEKQTVSKEAKETEEDLGAQINITFDIIYDNERSHLTAPNEHEMNEWMRLITLMQSRVIIHKTIKVQQVNKSLKYLYSINYIGENKEDAEKSQVDDRNKEYFIEINCFKEKWTIPKKIVDFIDWNEMLRKFLPNLILPTFPKNFHLGSLIANRRETIDPTKPSIDFSELSAKIQEHDTKEKKGKKERIRKQKKEQQQKKTTTTTTALRRLGNIFNDCFMNELLVNPQVNQAVATLEFFEILNIFRAVEQNNFEFVKFIILNNPQDCMKMRDRGKTPIHAACRKNIKMAQNMIESINEMKQNLDRFNLDSKSLYGCNINAQDSDGSTALLLAVREGNLKIFEFLLEQKDIDINVTDFKGISSFLESIKKRKLGFAQKLISKSCKIDCQDFESKYSALHFAFFNSDLDAIDFLISQSIPLDLQDVNGRTVLMLAISAQNSEVVSKLIASGADVNIQNFKKQSALHLSIEQNNVPLSKLLMENGANPNIQDENGETPLHLAITQQNIHLVQMLIENKCNCDIQNLKGLTPLHRGILLKDDDSKNEITNQNQPEILDHKENQLKEETNTKFEIVKLLVEKGRCKIDTQNVSGDYPVHTCVVRNAVDILTFLLKNKANVNVPDMKGNMPLHVANYLQNNRMVEILISFGATVNIANATSDGNSPIHIACEKGNLEGTLLLLRNGGYINCLRKDGKVPLHIASERGFDQLVSLFSENGADVNLQDKDGNTALHLSLKNGHERTAAILAQNGCYLNMINNKGQSPLQLAKNNKIRKMLKEASDRYATHGLKKKGTILNVVTDIIQPPSSIESDKSGNKKTDSHQHNAGAIPHRDSKYKVQDYLKVTFHTNHELEKPRSKIGVRLDTKTIPITHVDHIIEYANDKIGFSKDNKFNDFVAVYQDDGMDFNVIDNETDVDEIFRFATSLHIFKKIDLDNLFPFLK